MSHQAWKYVLTEHDEVSKSKGQEVSVCTKVHLQHLASIP